MLLAIIFAVFVAGLPGFEPRASGSEGPRFINYVSRENNGLETVRRNDYQARHPF
jgi:hypothetical protein